MSIDFVAFDMILLLINPSAVLLSVCIGVSGCGWPISSSVLRVGTAVFALMNRAPNSASAADDMTFLIICEMLRTAPLFGGFSSLFDKKWCSPALLRALFSDR